MLRQLQPLALVVRGRARAVELVGGARELFVDQPADGLPVLEQKRHVAAAHFQHRARAWGAIRTLAEARIETIGAKTLALTYLPRFPSA